MQDIFFVGEECSTSAGVVFQHLLSFLVLKYHTDRGSAVADAATQLSECCCDRGVRDGTRIGESRRSGPDLRSGASVSLNLSPVGGVGLTKFHLKNQPLEGLSPQEMERKRCSASGRVSRRVDEWLVVGSPMIS